jgi:VCBS repeat-containing protein
VSSALNAALANIASAFTITGAGVASASPASTTDTPVTNTVNWAFSLDNALTQYLAAGQSVTATYRITVTDDSGVASASGSNEVNARTQDVTVTLTGAGDSPSITVQSGNSDVAALTETNTPADYGFNTWMPVTGPSSNPTGAMNWIAVASSSDGNRLAASSQTDGVAGQVW